MKDRHGDKFFSFAAVGQAAPVHGTMLRSLLDPVDGMQQIALD